MGIFSFVCEVLTEKFEKRFKVLRKGGYTGTPAAESHREENENHRVKIGVLSVVLNFFLCGTLCNLLSSKPITKDDKPA
jgi:hypothetical protein